MLFNSISFALFLPTVFLLYWFAFDRLISKSKWQLKLQNAFVIGASYLFYGWWDWRFLILIALTSFCSWGSGFLINNSQSKRNAQRWMRANIIINIGILALFKYYNFFITEFGQLFGISTDRLLLQVILPVGISFYTFQALSYSIDVYRKQMEPTKDILAFFAFISFFPQLVACLERASNLLPQFTKKRNFDYATAVDGMRQILWGLFKKVVVADNCAIFVDQTFSSYTQQSGNRLLLAAIFFTFQIYGDFSGYSDIAIGTAKLFGIKLIRNFDVPYFSRNIAEFWRRWHISLTTWFRDYIYIPLGGSRVSKIKIIRNTFIIFLLSGLWHGANWTFIVWGGYHAFLFLPLILTGKNRKYTGQIAKGQILPTLKEVGQMMLTFLLTVFGWIIFRSSNIKQAFEYMGGIFNDTLLRYDGIPHKILFFSTIMLTIEWLHRGKMHGLDVGGSHFLIRWGSYIVILAMIFLYGAFNETFIYFQF